MFVDQDEIESLAGRKLRQLESDADGRASHDSKRVRKDSHEETSGDVSE